MAEKLHDAFISYSRKDRAFASLLEKALEAFSPPKIGNIPQKHLEIFRDEEDFTGTDYHKAVSKHLQDSRKLIVICTPAARASQYVNDEIRVFAETNGSEHIIPILLDGLPNNVANEQQEANKAFPDALVNYMQMPLAIDYRAFHASSDKVNKGKFDNPWFSLLANLYDIGRSKIEQRERKRQARIRNLWIGGLSSVIVILSVFLGLAVFNWFEAEQAREAEQQATQMAIGQRDKAQHALAVADFREAQRLIENHDPVRALAHLAQATRLDPLWISSRTLLVNLLQQKKWHLPNQILKHGDAVTFAAFSADGTRVVTASEDSSARVWDAQSGKALGEPMWHEETVNSVAFSADGTRVVTATDDGAARMWDAQSGKVLSEPMRHDQIVQSAAFSADGTRVVTASWDETARIWDAQSGKALGEPMRHKSYVRSAAFSSDGTRVVTVSGDGMVRVWDVLPILSDPDNRLAELAEAVVGIKLGDNGTIEILDNQIERLNQLRQQTANAPLGEPSAESFVRWFLSDPWTRTISPLSRKTVPEYIQQELAAGRREQVAQEFPGHPLLRQEKRTEDSMQHIELQPNPAVPIPAVKPSIPVVN